MGSELVKYVLALVLAAAVLLVVEAWRARGHPKYQRGRFLSRNEKLFLIALDQALGEGYRVFAQVRLADLVEVHGGRSAAKRQAALNKVFGKSVDFVICTTATLEPVAAIEVDDRTHLLPNRRERDVFVNRVFEEAGLPLLRAQARSVYSVACVKEMMARAGVSGRA